jgi:hypothetical protein
MEILGPVIYALGLSGFVIAIIWRARKEQDNDQD